MQRRGEPRGLVDGLNGVVVRDQRQFDTRQIRRGRPRTRCFRSADANRVNQQHLHAAIAHRAGELSRRVSVRRHGQRRCTAAERAARGHQIGTGIGDIGQLHPASHFAQHSQRVRRELRIEVQREFDIGAQRIGCRTK